MPVVNEKKTTLYVAARTGDMDRIKELLDTDSIEVDLADNLGWTALHWAANNGHLAAVKLLLSKGAAVNAHDNQGNTALHMAALGGYILVTQTLIEAQADIQAINSENCTALHLAARHGGLGAAQILVNKGANLRTPVKEGRTALHLAAMHGEVIPIRMLIKWGADISARDNKGRTPLDLAREFKMKAVVYFLERQILLRFLKILLAVLALLVILGAIALASGALITGASFGISIFMVSLTAAPYVLGAGLVGLLFIALLIGILRHPSAFSSRLTVGAILAEEKLSAVQLKVSNGVVQKPALNSKGNQKDEQRPSPTSSTLTGG